MLTVIKFLFTEHVFIWNNSLRNSGAEYVSNKMPINLAICWQKKLREAQQKPLYITLAMALAYLGILPRAMIWFFNS